MRPTVILLALFAAPILALVTDSQSGDSSYIGSTKYKRHAPQLGSARSGRTSKHRQRSTKSPFLHSSVKAPLTRLALRHERNAHLHPQVLLQQHIHRGVKRHARMTKRSLGEDAEVQMASRMVKRWESVQPRRGEAAATVAKRWLGGAALAGAASTVQQIQDRLSGILASDKTSLTNAVDLGPDGLGTARFGVSGYAGENIAASRSAKAESAAANTTLGETGGASSTKSNTADGFSKAELQAATNNVVTAAEAPTAAQSLGYFAPVQLGSEQQTFNILMDSGSADFWVPSTSCDGCGRHASIGPDTSSTFSNSGKPFSVSYGTGNVAGMTVSDTASIAGLNLTSLQFGVATTESNDFSDNSVPFDGLMGLGQSILSSQGIPTPIEQLASDGLVKSAQMGYHLGRVSDGKNDGEITFGGVDAGKFNGSLTEIPNVNQQGFWEGAMDDVAVDGESLKLSGRTAILDTGTTLLIAPAPDAEAIHAAIPGAQSDGQGGFTLPCTTNATLSLTFGGKAFPLQSSDLTFLPVTADLKGDCVSSISSGTIGGANEWLVGAVFLKNVYFATDVGSNVIGLAPAIDAS
ncbi:hypothetical protein JCM21900_002480 [Sporobolomyces salmonicolor]